MVPDMPISRRGLLVVASLLVAYTAAPMYAAGSQGTWLSIDGQNGTRGYVSASIPAPANSGGISTVRIEGSGGLAQIGPIKHGSSFM